MCTHTMLLILGLAECLSTQHIAWHTAGAQYLFEPGNVIHGCCVKMFAERILLMVHLFLLTIYFQIMEGASYRTRF